MSAAWAIWGMSNLGVGRGVPNWNRAGDRIDQDGDGADGRWCWADLDGDGAVATTALGDDDGD